MSNYSEDIEDQRKLILAQFNPRDFVTVKTATNNIAYIIAQFVPA